MRNRIHLKGTFLIETNTMSCLIPHRESTVLLVCSLKDSEEAKQSRALSDGIVSQVQI